MDQLYWFWHGYLKIRVSSSVDKKIQSTVPLKNAGRWVVCLSWTGNGFYLKVGVAWVDQTPPLPYYHLPPLCLPRFTSVLSEISVVGHLCGLVCLKTLMVQPVPLEPPFYQGPVTYFPTMIWKISGQIHSWPLFHAVAEWFICFCWTLMSTVMNVMPLWPPQSPWPHWWYWSHWPHSSTWSSWLHPTPTSQDRSQLVQIGMDEPVV